MNLRQIEEIALNAWPSIQQIFFDGWILRFSKGYTKRANSINALYAGESNLAEKVKACEQIYQEQGLPPIFRLTSFNHPEELDQLLQNLNYHLLDPTSVQYLDLEQIKPETPRGFEVWEDCQLEKWLQIFTRFSGKSEALNPLHQALLEHIPSQKILMVLRHQEQIVSCGLGVKERDHFGLFDMVTNPADRQQGFGKKTVSGMLDWGKKNGARHAYLQVVKANTPAIRLYAHFGYQEIYHYWYRVQ